MTSEEHRNWTYNVSQECTEIEILELLKLTADGKKVIVDTNISPDVLHEISDYNHAAIMLCIRLIFVQHAFLIVTIRKKVYDR